MRFAPTPLLAVAGCLVTNVYGEMQLQFCVFESPTDSTCKTTDQVDACTTYKKIHNADLCGTASPFLGGTQSVVKDDKCAIFTLNYLDSDRCDFHKQMINTLSNTNLQPQPFAFDTCMYMPRPKDTDNSAYYETVKCLKQDELNPANPPSPPSLSASSMAASSPRTDSNDDDTTWAVPVVIVLAVALAGTCAGFGYREYTGRTNIAGLSTHTLL